ncbi:MAG: hypothetical protein REI93_07875, partial [Pedobacter sp.]|nr:hypothetical protein [Pedobacter sp.]
LFRFAGDYTDFRGLHSVSSTILLLCLCSFVSALLSLILIPDFTEIPCFAQDDNSLLVFSALCALLFALCALLFTLAQDKILQYLGKIQYDFSKVSRDIWIAVNQQPSM